MELPPVKVASAIFATIAEATLHLVAGQTLHGVAALAAGLTQPAVIGIAALSAYIGFGVHSHLKNAKIETAFNEFKERLEHPPTGDQAAGVDLARLAEVRRVLNTPPREREALLAGSPALTGFLHDYARRQGPEFMTALDRFAVPSQHAGRDIVNTTMHADKITHISAERIETLKIDAS